jgi:hypothetical protein
MKRMNEDQVQVAERPGTQQRGSSFDGRNLELRLVALLDWSRVTIEVIESG